MSGDQAKPAYRDRYPCPGCSTGYLDCAQLWVMSLKCCADCSHPGHAEADPAFTDAEVDDMRRRAGMPPVDRSAGRVEVTLLGFELEIVERATVVQPLPEVIRRPVMRKLSAVMEEAASRPGWAAGYTVAEYQHQGGGTYLRVR